MDRLKLITIITDKIMVLVDSLQKEKSGKEFTLTVYEANMYWCINWKSTKTWKTDHYLKDSFQVNIYKINQNYFFMGEHRVEDLFEHLSKTYFLYEEKSIKSLESITDAIIEKITEGVLFWI